MKLTVLALVLVVAVLALPLCAVAATPKPGVTKAGLHAFTAGTNFMSVPGYARWQQFRQSGTWPAHVRHTSTGCHAKCATCPGSPNCATAFSGVSHFMSCMGFERWKSHKETGQWLGRCGVMQKMGCCTCPGK